MNDPRAGDSPLPVGRSGPSYSGVPHLVPNGWSLVAVFLAFGAALLAPPFSGFPDGMVLLLWAGGAWCGWRAYRRRVQSPWVGGGVLVVVTGVLLALALVGLGARIIG